MPGIRKILRQVSGYNGKIFFLQNMFFTLYLESLCRHLIFGKQNNTRGLLVEPSNWTDTDGVFFVLKVSSYLIGKCVCIMCTGWMGENSGWFVYGKDILIFIENIQRRKIIRNKLCRICFGSFQADPDLVTGEYRFRDPAAYTVFLNTIRIKFGAADLFFCQMSLRTEKLPNVKNI